MINKSTHDPLKLELFAPIMKSAEGDYLAVLSDDSIDRDDERISAGCIKKLGEDMGYMVGLMDHDNSVLKMVAEWVNRRVVELDGHTAWIAEPRFYESNPHSKIIKGMLDEGAKIGISIGAMIKNHEQIDGRTVYTELDVYEASFVAVPSNTHGRAVRVAKSFNSKSFSKKQKTEGKNMEELTQKDIDSAVEKAIQVVKDDTSKQLETKDSEISKLKKELEDKESEAEKEKEDSEKEKEDSEKKLKVAEKALEAEKKKSLEKSNYAKGDGEDDKPDDADVDKALKEGKLPIMKMAN